MTRKPKLLDLFAGAQGAAVGYARAGFEVHAVDIEPHDRHPEIASFTTADAFEVLADIGYCRGFDVITASPVCKLYTRLGNNRATHPNQIPAVRTHLRRIGRPHVLENVDTAPLSDYLTLCGSMFGLAAHCKDGRRRQLRRHRRFECDPFVFPPASCGHCGEAIGVYGHGGHIPSQRGYQGNKQEASEAMGIDWMTMADLSQAIPPAYTQWIGEQLMEQLATSDSRGVPA